MGACSSTTPKPAKNTMKNQEAKPETMGDVKARRDRLAAAITSVQENSSKLDDRLNERVEAIITNEAFTAKKGTLDSAKVVLEYEAKQQELRSCQQ